MSSSGNSKVLSLNEKKRPGTAGRKKRIKRSGAGDFALTVLVMILVLFGIVMVFSASYYTALIKENDPYFYFKKEILFAATGLVLFIMLAMIDYHKILKWSYGIYILAVLLVAVTYTPLGGTYNGAARWIQIGPLTLIPGEFAKLAVILLVARWFSSKPDRIDKPVKGLLPVMAMAAVCVVLVAKQPSTTTALTIAMILVIMLFVSGTNMKYMAALFGIGIAGGAAFLFKEMANGGYKSARITSFLDPFADEKGDGYQVVQGLYALASGGLKGVGPGNSVQKNLHLPDPQNDFILAIIGEELGYIGLLVLLAVYLLLIWRCVHIALRAPDLGGMLMASGITIMLAGQVILNVMVVTSMMPPTGIALPFVSYGGTAMWLFMMAMGLIVNISRQQKAEPGEEGEQV
ncbi:MAG: putative lipid II flippase FtsW [Anaerovoracaceae bacterium]|nr:putative lipid II flippase FtsW [Bacillota bacterium]MDY2670171.1 putative lipid II flippase FtsW [Anaerovoracaceae bacterium]